LVQTQKMLGFLKATKNEILSLEGDDFGVITWHVDAAYAVHQDYKSQTGATMTLGKGAILCS
jgi:hypothetical protein